MNTVLQDLRVAARALLQRPAFTVAAVLTLGLGIGVTTAMFSVLFGVVVRPLPYRDSDRLVALWQTQRQNPTRNLGGSISQLNYHDWTQSARSFEGIAVFS